MTGVLADASSNMALVVTAFGSLGLAGTIVAVVTLGSTRRKAKAGADEAEASAERADIEIGDLRQKLTTQVLESVNSELARYREQVAEERTRAAGAVQGQAVAQAALAKVQLELAQALEQASRERHDMRNEMAALGAENARLKIQVSDLRIEVDSLRAQLDTERHGRRRTDPPEDH